MTLANWITLGRAVFLIPCIWALVVGRDGWSAGLFVLASAGDVLDGMVARARHEVTTWGKALDPLVDKAAYLAVFCTLVVLGRLPIWVLVLFALPQLLLGIGALVLRLDAGLVQGARILGKAAAVLTFLSAFSRIQPWWLFGREAALYVLYAAIALTYLATLDYARSALRLRANGSLRTGT
ncbi:CDP-alcohol phosphatidyltransferase family protein [Candidatus Bipolaricaulota bacterium]|nr:CDP-alcohol phosphatidyltransferase family protein [Candidatus Bipolaricaulota bacterium]